jgi:hypothetical protein
MQQQPSQHHLPLRSVCLTLCYYTVLHSSLAKQLSSVFGGHAPGSNSNGNHSNGSPNSTHDNSTATNDDGSSSGGGVVRVSQLMRAFEQGQGTDMVQCVIIRERQGLNRLYPCYRLYFQDR